MIIDNCRPFGDLKKLKINKKKQQNEQNIVW